MNMCTYGSPKEIPESKYIPLDVMSDFSIGESVARIPDLVKKAKSLNMKSLALTDRTLDGAIDFYRLCRQNNIKPIIGQKIVFGNSEVNLLCRDCNAYKILSKSPLEFPLSEEDASHFICISPDSDSKLKELFAENFYTQISFTDLLAQPDIIEKYDTAKCVITNPVRFIEKEDSEALSAMKLHLNNSPEVESVNYFKDDTEILPFLEKINHTELLENLHHIEEQISFIFPEDYFELENINNTFFLETSPDFENVKKTLNKFAYGSIQCWDALVIAGMYLNYPDEEIKRISDIIKEPCCNCMFKSEQLQLDDFLNHEFFLSEENVSYPTTVFFKKHWEGVKVLGFLRDKKNEKLVKITKCLENLKCKGITQLTKLNLLSEEITKRTKKEFDYKKISLEDESTIKAFAKGRTTGIFQFGSPAMKKILKLFNPEKFSDLVIVNVMFTPKLLDYIPEVLENRDDENYIERCIFPRFFSGYDFNKFHTAAYTLMTYWEMYIKLHYPKEYRKVNENFKTDFDWLESFRILSP